MLNLSLLQASAVPTEPLRNLETAKQLIDRAPGRLVALPEMFAAGYDLTRMGEVDPAEVAEFRSSLRHLSAESGKTIVCGCPGYTAEDDRPTNEAVVFQDGQEVAVYSKIHHSMCEPINEYDVFTSGDKLTTFQVGDWKCGLSICYDLRFPEVFAGYRKKGVELQILISAWPLARASHWVTLVKARAIETQTFVAACGMTGDQYGSAFCGRSIICDPWGNTLAETDAFSTTVVSAELDHSQLEKYRAFHPILRHKRADLYRNWS